MKKTKITKSKWLELRSWLIEAHEFSAEEADYSMRLNFILIHHLID